MRYGNRLRDDRHNSPRKRAEQHPPYPIYPDGGNGYQGLPHVRDGRSPDSREGPSFA